MIIIFVFQLSACIAGYALRGNALAIMHREMTASMDYYIDPNRDMEVVELWDNIQREVSKSYIFFII